MYRPGGSTLWIYVSVVNPLAITYIKHKTESAAKVLEDETRGRYVAQAKCGALHEGPLQDQGAFLDPRSFLQAKSRRQARNVPQKCT